MSYPFSLISVMSSASSTHKDGPGSCNAFDEAEREGIILDPEAYEETAEVQLYNAQGTPYMERIEKSLLDMTDRQNLAFRYVL